MAQGLQALAVADAGDAVESLTGQVNNHFLGILADRQVVVDAFDTIDLV